MAPPYEPARDLSGHVLERQFRLERLLGRGGMGDVYLAEQLEVGRRVVIKMLRAAQLSDDSSEARFKREARALAQLNHPNIVHLYTFGRSEDGTAYLAMEHIDGRTLGSLVADSGALPEEQVISILDQVCSALVEAHQQGIIHRDLKPDNVMVVERHDQPPRVKVLDFGIAKFASPADNRITLEGEILGTPLYMAPEQLREHRADERTDIYALASIGYELLTGTVPFEAETTLSLIVRVMTEDVVPPRRRVPGLQVSASTDALILRCLAKDPRERIQSAREMRDALTEIARELIAAPATISRSQGLSLPVRVEAEPSLARIAPPRRRRQRPIGVLLGLVVLLACAVGARWIAGEWREEQAQVEVPSTGPLQVQEWVQGIPFPSGVEYAAFEPGYVDVSVPADTARVLAFYREHLAEKWGGSRVLGDGLVFDDPLAPIARLTVSATREGSRITVVRRQLAP